MNRLLTTAFALSLFFSVSALGADSKKKPAAKPAAPATETQPAPAPAPVAHTEQPTHMTHAVDHSEEGSRAKNKIGLFVGGIDPFPSLLAGNIGYNFFEVVRLSAGYGSVSSGAFSAKTIGANVRGFIPGWNFSPTVGLGWASVTITVDPAAVSTSTSVQGFSASGSHVYGIVGFDWQTDGGFLFGAGYNFSFQSGVGGLPYLNLGWFFNWF